MRISIKYCISSIKCLKNRSKSRHSIFLPPYNFLLVKGFYLVCLVLVVLTGINLEWELISNRLLRVVTSFTFLIPTMAILCKRGTISLPLIALLLLAICDVFLLNWEFSLAKPMYYTVHSFASILFLSSMNWKKNKPKISKFDWTYILIATSILSWVMIRLGHFFSTEINEPFLQVLFYSNGFLSVFLTISAFIFSANSTDDYSSYYLLAVVGLAISDLFLFMIFIMEFQGLKYLDNLLNIIGCTFLVLYIMKKQAFKEKENNRLINEKREEMNNQSIETLEGAGAYN